MGIEDYGSIFDQAGTQYGVDPQLLRAMAETESHGDPNALGPDTKYGNASGIMQLIPDTARRLGVTNPNDPKQAIPAAARLMKENMDRYKSPEQAVMAYHGGTDQKNWGPKTQDYAQKVMTRYKKPGTDQNIGSAADDELLSMFEKPANKAAVPTQPASPASGEMSDDDLLNLFTKPPSAAPVVAAPQAKGFLDRMGDAAVKAQEQGQSRAEREAAGSAQGVRDVVSSVQDLTGHPTIGGILPTAEENIAARNKFNQQYGSDALAGMGRFGGNVVASAPLMMGAEAGLGAVGGMLTRAAPETLGPAIRFLTGNTESNAITNAAGETIKGATAGNKLVRATSQATRGGAQGAGAMALIHTASDSPLMDQLATGTAMGSFMGPLGMAGAGAMNYLRGNSSSVEPYLQKIAQSFTRDNVPLGEIKGRLEQMGPEATLMDVGGPNTRALAGAVAHTPGPGKQVVETALENRHAGQVDRLTQLATGNLNVEPGTTYEGTVNKLIDQRAESAKPLYEKAFSQNQNISSNEINAILETPAGKKALGQARELMLNSRSLMGVNDPELAEQAKLVGAYAEGQGGIASGLKMRTLDYVKQGLDDQYETAIRAGENRKASGILQLKNKLLNEMDSADVTAAEGKPGAYAQGRAAFRDPSQSMEAIDAGRNFVSGDSRAAMGKMSDQDKQFFRIGVANKLTDIIENTPDGADAVKRIFGSPAKRKALASVFPSEEAFKKFEQEVMNEAAFSRTRQSIIGNSQTAPRAAAMEDAAMMPNPIGNTLNKLRNLGFTPGNVAATFAGNPMALGIDVGKGIFNKFTAPRSMSPETAEQIGRAMVSPGSAVESITPGSGNVPQGGQNLLQQYMRRLGIPDAVMGTQNLQQYPQQ